MAALAEVDHESKQQSRTSSPTDRGGRFTIVILQGQGLFLRTTSLELTQRRFRVNSIVGTKLRFGFRNVIVGVRQPTSGFEHLLVHGTYIWAYFSTL